METFQLADAIRKEIKRQATAKPKVLWFNPANSDPDDVARVCGKLDLYEIAKALLD